MNEELELQRAEHTRAMNEWYVKEVNKAELNFLIDYAEQNGYTIKRKMPDKRILSDKITKTMNEQLKGTQ